MDLLFCRFGLSPVRFVSAKLMRKESANKHAIPCLTVCFAMYCGDIASLFYSSNVCIFGFFLSDDYLARMPDDFLNILFIIKVSNLTGNL